MPPGKVKGMKLSVNAGVVEELAMAVPPDAFFHFEGYFDEGGVYVPVRRVSEELAVITTRRLLVTDMMATKACAQVRAAPGPRPTPP